MGRKEPIGTRFFFQAEEGIRDSVASRGLGEVYKRQGLVILQYRVYHMQNQKQ